MSELLEKDAEFAELVRFIGETQKVIGDQALVAYAPLVNDVCSRIASEDEVDHLLDYLLDFASFDCMLSLFKRVCRHYYPLYPEVVGFHVKYYIEECADVDDGDG